MRVDRPIRVGNDLASNLTPHLIGASNSLRPAPGRSKPGRVRVVVGMVMCFLLGAGKLIQRHRGFAHDVCAASLE